MPILKTINEIPILHKTRVDVLSLLLRIILYKKIIIKIKNTNIVKILSNAKLTQFNNTK